MQASAAPIFKRGPSLLTRLAFFSLLSLAFIVADVRFRYLEEIRAGVSVALYPLQEVASLPGALFSRMGDFFVTQASLSRDNEQLKRERLLSGAAPSGCVPSRPRTNSFAGSSTPNPSRGAPRRSPRSSTKAVTPSPGKW